MNPTLNETHNGTFSGVNGDARDLVLLRAAPPDQQPARVYLARPRVLGEVASLGTAAVGEEDDPAVIGALHQDETYRRHAPSADGGERHRLGLGKAGTLCIGPS